MSCTETKIAKVQMNISNSQSPCRVCLKKSNSMEELFGSDCKIVARIQFCTGILLKENPTLPSLICAECITHLNIAHNFKTTCMASDKMFKIDVKVEVKTEILEVTFVKEEIEDLYENDEINDSKDTMRLLEQGPKPDVKPNIVKLPSPKPKENVKQSLNSTKTIKLKVGCKEDAAKKAQNKTKKEKARQKFTFRKLFCLKCKIKFDSKEESIKHHETFHNKSKYVCEVCGKQFVYQAGHYAHMRIHVGRSYSCAHCAYATVTKYDLITHLRLHTGEKKYQCHVCPDIFRTSSSLHSHTRHKHGGQKKFPCDRCNKSFFSGHRLRRHIDAHNNIKRYECSVCHSCFVHRWGWKRHLLSQHAVTVPNAKPGPKKTNIVVESVESTTNSQ